MDEPRFIDSLLCVCTSRAEAIAILDTAIEELSLDSLDFEILRTQLEKDRGAAVEEHLWQTAPTLRSLMHGL